MARLPLLTAEDLPSEDRDVLNRPINLYRIFAHSPEMARRYRGIGQWIRWESELPPRLRELAILQVGYIAGSEYEWSHHVKIGLEAGVTESDIEAIALETAGKPSTLDALTRDVLTASRRLTETSDLDDELWQSLLDQLGGAQALELCTVIAFYNMTVRLLFALRIDVEPEYLGYLERFPLPLTEPGVSELSETQRGVSSK